MLRKFVLATVNQDYEQSHGQWVEGTYHTFYYTAETELDDTQEMAMRIRSLRAADVIISSDAQETGLGINVHEIQGPVIHALSNIVGSELLEPVYATVSPVRFREGTHFRIGEISILQVTQDSLREVVRIRLQRPQTEYKHAIDNLLG